MLLKQKIAANGINLHHLLRLRLLATLTLEGLTVHQQDLKSLA